MKRILILVALLAILASCKKSNVEVFDKKPEERLSISVSEAKTTLLSAQNGWIATLPTSAGGGYGFYMSFDAAENVKMLGDLNAAAISTSATSTYRLKAVLGTELIFDTFNYISLLVDPVPGVFGGAAGSGYKSDIEFLFTKSTADTLVLTGKKYGQVMKMVKATAAQKTAYENGGYKTAIDKFKDFFTATKNPYIEYTAGNTQLKVGLSLDFNNTLATGKRVSFAGPLADGKISTAVGKFGLTINGADILGAPLVYQGITFTKFVWKDAATLILIDSNGKEYIIKSNPIPLIEFKTVFAYNGTYNGIMITGSVLPAGITSGWNTLWSAQIANYALNNVTMESMQFRLINATTAKLEVWFVSGTTRYLADASYTYTIVDDVITLSNYIPSVSNTNWNNGWVTTAIKNYFTTSPSFKMDWVPSSDPTVSNIGGLYKVSDPSNFYYGRMIKN
ncbi:DUF4302 domain-containing protein [Pedobacter xixiisoli]|uniref:DUF4302 domain-containing protein n=1 Tax=Pedobacter xixiisoli TaxID=1476464 RepID=A0A286AEX9_9SPHI|nr:DUF4302 domain-containing protein [Pedobacter xixiisoli]SOD20458.1 protein of unknown function [Pedobacter xixiisoli]